MPIEVDQSNKIERMDKDTILAFADGRSFSVVIPARVKRRALEILVSKKKPRKMAYLMLFAAGLFILLRDYLSQAADPEETVVIDTEYSGREADIRATLLRYAQKKGWALRAERFVFRQVGKGSRAHVLAWNVQRGKLRAGYRITLKDLSRLI